MEEAVCVGCGCDCLDIIECNCTEEMYACEECLDSDITLVCGKCRDRAQRVVPLSSYPCRGFQEDEAGPDRDMGGGGCPCVRRSGRGNRRTVLRDGAGNGGADDIARLL